MPVTWNTLAATSAILLARTIPLVEAAPFFGGRAGGRLVKLAFAVGLAALLFPLAVPASVAAPGGLALGGVLIREAAIGLTLGLLSALVFEAFEVAGRLIDLSATGRNDEPPPAATARFLQALAIPLFFAVGGHRIWLYAVARSYEVWSPFAPPGPPIDALAVGRLFADAVTFGVLLAVPVMAAMLLSDVTLTILQPIGRRALARAPTRGLVALAVLLIGLGTFTDRIAARSVDAMLELTHYVEDR